MTRRSSEAAPIPIRASRMAPHHEDLRESAVPDARRREARTFARTRHTRPEEGVCQRATFVVDPDNIIRFVSVTDLSVGRSVDEVLRVLDALQTDELCPCNWQKGRQRARVMCSSTACLPRAVRNELHLRSRDRVGAVVEFALEIMTLKTSSTQSLVRERHPGESRQRTEQPELDATATRARPLHRQLPAARPPSFAGSRAKPPGTFQNKRLKQRERRRRSWR